MAIGTQLSIAILKVIELVQANNCDKDAKILTEYQQSELNSIQKGTQSMSRWETEQKPQQKANQIDHMDHSLVSLWCRATQDRRVTVESSDKTWSTGEGNGRPLQYSCFESSTNSMKRQKDMTLKDWQVPNKEQYCIGTLNVWAMIQGKLEVFKKEVEE